MKVMILKDFKIFKFSMLKDMETKNNSKEREKSSLTSEKSLEWARKLPPPAPKPRETDLRIGWRKQELPARPIKAIRKPENFKEIQITKPQTTTELKSGKISSRIDIIPQKAKPSPTEHSEKNENLNRGRQFEKRPNSGRALSVGRLSRKREIIGQFEPPKYVLECTKEPKNTKKR